MDHLQFLKNELKNYDLVLLAADWTSYLKDDQGFKKSLTMTLKELDLLGPEIVVVASIPRLDKEDYLQYMRAKYTLVSPHHEHDVKRILLQKLKRSHQVLRSNKEIEKLTYNQSQSFLNPISDDVTFSPFSADQILYKDGTHFNYYGANYLGRKYKQSVIKNINQLLSRPTDRKKL